MNRFKPALVALLALAAASAFAVDKVEDLTLRLGDFVTLPVKNGDSLVFVRLACSRDVGQMLFTAAPRRVYPGGFSKWTRPTLIPPEQVTEFRKTDPGFANDCARLKAPQWQQVATPDAEPRVALDPTLMQRTGDLVRGPVLFDYADITYDPPYSAPLSQKLEITEFDCKAQTMAIRLVYDLDEASVVTDLNYADKPEMARPVSPSDQALLKVVCGLPATQALSEFTPRFKHLVTGANQPLTVPPALQAQFAALEMPTPAHDVASFTTHNTAAATGAVKVDQVKHQVSAERPGPLWTDRSTSARFTSTEISFRGLIRVASQTHFDVANGVDDAMQLVSVRFNGDWAHLAAGGKVGFETVMAEQNAFVGKVQQTVNTQCDVQPAVAASTLDAALTGQALPLICHDKVEKSEYVSRWYYLADYVWFFRAAADAQPAASDTQLLDVIAH